MRASSPIDSSRKIAKQAVPALPDLRLISHKSSICFLNGLHGKLFFHAHFFKILSSIFGKTRLSGFVGSRGGNKNLYGRSRAWVVRARFYRGAIIRCPLILSHRNWCYVNKTDTLNLETFLANWFVPGFILHWTQVVYRAVDTFWVIEYFYVFKYCFSCTGQVFKVPFI